MSRVEAHFCALFDECSRSGFCIQLKNGVYKCVCLSPFVSPNCTIPISSTTIASVNESGIPIGYIVLMVLLLLLLMAYFGFVWAAKKWYGEQKSWWWAFVLPFVRLGVLLRWIYHLLPFVKSETVVKKKRQSDNDHEEKSTKKKEGVNVVIELSNM